MELLSFVCIFASAWIVLLKPEREPLAFGLLVTSMVLVTTLFLMATRTSILPGVNY